MTIPRPIVAFLLSVLLAGCGDPLEGKVGEDLYLHGCAHCHGVDLSGGTGPNIGPGSNADVGLSDGQVRDVIKVGPGSMPGFGDRLTDAQVESLVIYLRLIQRGAGGG